MQRLSSAERLLRTIRGEPVGRIPILSPLDWAPVAREIEPGSWRDEPNYRGLVPLVAESCDFLVDLVVPEGCPIALTGRMTLIGNIEMVDLETETPEVIEERVRDAVCLGGRDHFILSASDFTISRVSDRMRENIRRFVEAGIKYGILHGSNPCLC